MSSPDVEAVDEQLTAYLDGELSAEEASSIENRLVTDETLRLRLVVLRKAYDLLDELPETPHNQRFTKSTLELVIKDLASTQSIVRQPIVKPIPRAARPTWWQWPRILVLIGMFFLVGIASGLVVRFAKMNQEIRNLGLIANLPGMSDVNDLSIAVNLSKEKAAIEVLRNQFRDKLLPPVPESIWTRKNWVESLGPLQIERLNRGRVVLGKLDQDTYKRFVAIESQIENRPDGKEIQDAIHVIGMVMDILPNSKRLDLDALNQTQRTQFLREQLCFSAAMAYATQISVEDAKALEAWSETSFIPALVQEVPWRSYDPKDPKDFLLSMWYRLNLRRENGLQLENQDELVEALLPRLSDTGRSLIEGIGKSDQLSVLLTWLVPARPKSTQTLMDEYEKIGREFRDRIDLSEPREAKRAVEDSLRRPSGSRSRRP